MFYLNRFEEALLAYEKVIELEPKTLATYSNEGEVKLKKGLFYEKYATWRVFL